jgi:hypothetical protein
MGADIAGACGQLVVEQEKHLHAVSDIEDGPFSEKTNIKHDRKVNKTNSRSPTPPRDHEVNVDNKDVNLIRLLTIATAISTSCFILSTALFVFQRRKR